MKSTIVSMSIVLIVLMIIPVFMFGEDNLLERFGFGSGGSGLFDVQKDKTPRNVQAVTTDKRVELYKWVDEHGVVQFSNIPPEQGIASEKIVLSPNVNVMDAVKVPEKEAGAVVGPQVFSTANPYTPDGAKEIIDQALKMQEQLSQQQADQKKMLQDMLK